MARGVNKVILLGHLGADPETRYTAGGNAVTSIRLATTDSWKDKAGDRQERTEWHRVVFFARIAEVAAQYLGKGSQCYVEGRIQTRKWQGKDGQDRYTTEVIASELLLLNYKDSGDSSAPPPSASRSSAPPAGHGGGDGGRASRPPSKDFDDDIPF